MHISYSLCSLHMQTCIKIKILRLDGCFSGCMFRALEKSFKFFEADNGSKQLEIKIVIYNFLFFLMKDLMIEFHYK